MPPPSAEIDLPVYPDECDAFGHLNQASFLSLFERARWEMLIRGPGMDVFTRAGAWPAVRKTVIDYHAAAFPGDVLRFHQVPTHRGRTSFAMRQTARRLKDDALIATAEFVFVCIDRDGRPMPVPTEFSAFMNAPLAPGDMQRLTVNGVSLAVEVRGEGPAVLFVHGYPFDHTIWRDQFDRHRVRGVVLMDTRADAEGAEARRARDAAAATAREDGAGAIAELMLPKLLAPGTAERAPEIAERLRRMMAATPVAGIVGALGAMRDRRDSTDLLPALAGLPVLVMVGEEDVLTPPDAARRLAAAIPHARLVVVPGAGHVTPVERPAETNAALLEFLRVVG